jgi:hypothetical protein
MFCRSRLREGNYEKARCAEAGCHILDFKPTDLFRRCDGFNSTAPRRPTCRDRVGRCQSRLKPASRVEHLSAKVVDLVISSQYTGPDGCCLGSY